MSSFDFPLFLYNLIDKAKGMGADIDMLHDAVDAARLEWTTAANECAASIKEVAEYEELRAWDETYDYGRLACDHDYAQKKDLARRWRAAYENSPRYKELYHAEDIASQKLYNAETDLEEALNDQEHAWDLAIEMLPGDLRDHIVGRLQAAD